MNRKRLNIKWPSYKAAVVIEELSAYCNSFSLRRDEQYRESQVLRITSDVLAAEQRTKQMTGLDARASRAGLSGLDTALARNAVPKSTRCLPSLDLFELV